MFKTYEQYEAYYKWLNGGLDSEEKKKEFMKTPEYKKATQYTNFYKQLDSKSRISKLKRILGL